MRYLFPAMWLAWAAYWWVSSRNVKVAARRESAPSRLWHIAPILVAVALLLWPRRAHLGVLGERLLPPAGWLFWTGAAVTAAGLLFALWARRHLAGNWSGTVTIKKGHELVTSGPYAIVRHPIYSGLLLALVGSAIARCDWGGALAVMLVFASFWRKLLLEERWMEEEFGEEFRAYRRRVPALVPHLL